MTAQRTIGVLGVSARAAACSALRAGYLPLAADAFADADLLRLVQVERVDDYPAGFAPWLARQTVRRPDLPWLYTGALENYPRLLAQLARRGRLLGVAPHLVTRVRSPFRLARVLADAKLAMPETQRTAAGLPTDGTWLRKKRQSAGGNGVSIYAGGRVPSGDYLQQRIDGLPTSAVYVGHSGGAHCYGVTRQLVGEAWTGASGYRYCGAIGPWPVCRAVAGQIERIGSTIAAAFGLRGLFGVDLILADETAWVVEVNPRYTASVEILERVVGTPAIALHLAACQGDRLTIPSAEAGCHGKAILFATQDLVVDDVVSEQLLADAGDWRTPQWADLPAGGTTIPAGRPVLTAFASAATCNEVERQLQQRVSALQVRLNFARSRTCC